VLPEDGAFEANRGEGCVLRKRVGKYLQSLPVVEFRPIGNGKDRGNREKAEDEKTPLHNTAALLLLSERPTLTHCVERVRNITRRLLISIFSIKLANMQRLQHQTESNQSLRRHVNIKYRQEELLEFILY